MIEWFSSLNFLKAFTMETHRALNLSFRDEPLHRYTHILLSCLCAAYDDETICEIVSSNPLLSKPIEIGKRFIDTMNRLSNRAVAISGASILYAIKKAEDILRTYEKKPFIVLCDCLSLPEYIYLYDRFSDRVDPNMMLYAINPGGMTKTFEHLAKAYLNIFHDEVTMTMLAEGLKNQMKAAGSLVYRSMDKLIHKHGDLGFINLSDMAINLYRVIEELTSKIGRILEKNCVLVISDHGYDVFFKDDKWYPFHRFSHEKNCLSTFSATLLIGDVLNG